MTMLGNRYANMTPAKPRLTGRTPSTWRSLYLAAGWAALISALLVPLQVGVFTAFPYPETVTGWFRLLEMNPVAGLIDLDALLVLDNVLLIPMALGVYVALRRTGLSTVTIAMGLWFLSIVLMISSNPSVEMLTLTDRFSEAATAGERTAIVGAAEAALATWDGTGFQVAYIAGQAAGIALGLVMLRDGSFGRAVPVAMIAGNVIGFGYYLPEVGLAVSAFSGLILWAWYVLIGLRFLKLARAEA
jgi:hypothetical protein